MKMKGHEPSNAATESAARAPKLVARGYSRLVSRAMCFRLAI